MRRHAALLPVSLATAAFALAACGAVGIPASDPASPNPASPGPASPETSPGLPAGPAVPADAELVAQGTVLQEGESLPKLCLGAVMESYPPQCSGPDLLNWNWDEVEQAETASGVTWGTYAVYGTWDGTAFTRMGDPIPLSLYDPMADFDPRLDPANPGAGDEAELEELQLELMEDEPRILSSSVANGYVFVTVVYDDGTLQERYDEKYGPDMVAVQSALQPVS